MLKDFLVILIAASWIYWLLAWRVVAWFFRKHYPIDENFHPSVSILRPVKGADAYAYDNFLTLCDQDYKGQTEILFAVADERDPAIPIVHKLQRDFPGKNIRLIIAPSDFLNPKVGNLHNLASSATGELLVLSDADIRVTPDYLTRVTAPFSDPSIGIVTCPYHASHCESFAAHLEALDIESQFLPATIIASRLLHARMGLGATLAFRRTDLDRIGGFASIADYLADDFQLADRIANLGLKIHLCDYLVSSVMGEVRFIDHFHRQVRWMRCVRVSDPLRYPGVAITFATPLAALLLLFPHFLLPAICILAASVLLRWFVAWRIRRFLGIIDRGLDLLYLPLRDFLTAFVFLTAAFGRRITWRGQKFKVQSDGRLQRLDSKKTFLQRLIIAIDAILRRRQGIYEFTSDPDCLFRLSLARCPVDITLPTGLRLNKNDPILELHFWTDHFPSVPVEGPGLDWAKQLFQKYIHSLELLADHVHSNAERYSQINALHGVASSPYEDGINHLHRIARRSGFDVFPALPPATFLARLHRRGEDLLIWLLHYCFVPTTPRGRFGQARLCRDCWITIEKLLARHDRSNRTATKSPEASCSL